MKTNKYIQLMSAVILSVLLVCSCADKSGTYSSEIPEQITETDLLNNKAEINRKNNTIFVTGKIVDFEIKDENDAFRAVVSLVDFMKIRDFNNEIRFESVSKDKFSTAYIFSQYYQGLEVIGTRINLRADPETNMANELFCSYIPIDMDITPEITIQKVSEIISKKYDSELVHEPELKIYIDDSTPYLAWHITAVKEPSEIWLNAKTGDIIYAEYPADYFGGA